MRIAVVDDTISEQKYVCECIERFFKEHQMKYELAVFSSGSEFLRRKDFGFDIALLDICMEGINGFETAQCIRHHNQECRLIFLTVSDDFAVRSYRVQAFDYFIKPYTYDQFAETMERCVKSLNIDASYIELKSSRMHVRVMCREILYADYHNHYVQIHTDSDIIRSKMYFDELETMLKDPRFLYCNRNCMVNMDRIKGVEKLGFLMENGEYVPIKKADHRAIQQAYADYVFKKMAGTDHG